MKTRLSLLVAGVLACIACASTETPVAQGPLAPPASEVVEEGAHFDRVP